MSSVSSFSSARGLSDLGEAQNHTQSARSQRSDISELESEFDDRADTDSSALHRSALDRNKKAANAEITEEMLAVIHQDILNSLKCSKTLRPMHVEVQNESYWYAMRKKLGAKKQNAIAVKQNAISLKWEVYIYKIALREEDLEMVPKRVLVGDAKSKLQAFRLGERACRQRDENPATNRKMAKTISDPSKILSTHLKINVVSKVFDRVHHLDRICMVHEAMLRHFGSNLTPLGQCSGLAQSPPVRMKIGSTFGAAMCSLDLFRFILPSHYSLTLLVEALTPSQWNPTQHEPPLSERLGPSHMSLTSKEIPKIAQPNQQKKRIGKLGKVALKEEALLSHSQSLKLPSIVKSKPHEQDRTTASANSRLLSAPRACSSDKLPSITMSETLGLDPSVSGVRYKRLGGIYGHFFNDLSASVKERVMEKYKDNKYLIQLEGSASYHEEMERQRKQREDRLKGIDLLADPDSNLDFDATFAPHTNASKTKQSSKEAPKYDKGTTNEQEMLEEVGISNRRIERLVLRLQRIRRITLYQRALKKWWWRSYSALTIQRVVRGRFGCLYARLYSKLRPLVCIRIQRCWRNMKTRVILKCWRFLTFRLTRVALPKIKRFIRNCYLSWIAKRNVMAIRIQCVVRMRIALTKYYHRLGELHFDTRFVRAAVTIQRLMRGFLGRRLFARHVEAFLVWRIDVPAAVMIQRKYRGRLGVKKAAYWRYCRECLITIQMFARRCVKRRWKLELMRNRLLEHSALTIQRIFRGALDRELYRHEWFTWWYRHKFMPAVIKTQAVARKFKVRKQFQQLKRRSQSARFLQRVYKDMNERVKAKLVANSLRILRKDRAITVIQTLVRKFLAKLDFRRKLLAQRGEIVRAGKMISRVWQNYLFNRRYEVLLDVHKEELSREKIKRYMLIREDLGLDIGEIKDDIALANRAVERNRQRLKEIEVFMLEASLRINRVKKEMAALTSEDFERGSFCC